MSATENTGPPKAKSSIPSQSDESWLEHAQKEMQNEPARMEDTAKFLVAIISISLTLFLTKRPEGLAVWTNNWFIIAGVLWMAAALASFFVLFPKRYNFYDDSPEDIKKTYREIANNKRIVLMISVAFFLAALGVAGYAFLCGVR